MAPRRRRLGHRRRQIRLPKRHRHLHARRAAALRHRILGAAHAGRLLRNAGNDNKNRSNFSLLRRLFLKRFAFCVLSCMQVFSVEGDFVEALEFPWMGRMAGVHVDQRRIFAADWDLHLVQVILRVTPHGSAAYSSGKQLLRTSTAVQSVDKLSAVSSSQPGAKKPRGQTEKGHAQAVRDVAGNSGGGGGGSTHADAHASVAEGGAAHRQSAGAAPAAVSALMERPSDSPRSSRAAAKPSKHKKAGSKGHTHAAEHTTERTARRRR
eukprot:2524322-Pleurochrysis_carterae.AAC.1